MPPSIDIHAFNSGRFMKFVLIALAAANLALLAWFQGWMAPYGGDGRQPQRLARQISADRIKVVAVDETQRPNPSKEVIAPVTPAVPPEAVQEPAASPEPAPRAAQAARRPRNPD
jgi:hypothetical protein